MSGREARWAEFEEVNEALARVFKGDSVQNVDRIMRLAGTMNLPTATKLKKGRVPIRGKLIGIDEDAICTFEQMRDLLRDEYKEAWKPPEPKPGKAPKASGGPKESAKDVALSKDVITDIDKLPVSGRIKSLIRGIDDPEYQGDKSSSAVLWRILIAMATARCSDGTMRAIVAQCEAAADNIRKNRGDVYLSKQIAKAREKAPKNFIDQFNTEYAVINLKGKARVLRLPRTVEDDLEFSSFGDFSNLTCNRIIEIKDGKDKVKKVRSSLLWLQSPKRLEYTGLVMDPKAPTTRPGGAYNLWRGFSVMPDPTGSCAKFITHVRDNVANGNEDYFRWIVGWFAQIVQQPWIKIGSALTLRGGQGTGKTKVGECVGSLISGNYLPVARDRLITGNFNSHFAKTILLQAEEAIWAGDQKAKNLMKDLITSSTINIELKGLELITMNNYTRFFTTSNEDWVVPAELDDRRNAVFDVGTGAQKNFSYFAAIDDERNNGGREALLHYLLNFDLNSVNLRDPPKTQALLEQKRQSLDPLMAFLIEVGTELILPGDVEGDGPECSTDSFFARYRKHAEEAGRGKNRFDKIGFGMKLFQIFKKGELRKHKDRPIKMPPKWRDGSAEIRAGRTYAFGSPEDFRAALDAKAGQRWDWGDATEWRKDGETISKTISTETNKRASM